MAKGGEGCVVDADQISKAFFARVKSIRAALTETEKQKAARGTYIRQYSVCTFLLLFIRRRLTARRHSFINVVWRLLFTLHICDIIFP